MRQRLRQAGLREIRLMVPDARAAVVRERIAEQVKHLSPISECDALNWVEEVSEFDDGR